MYSKRCLLVFFHDCDCSERRQHLCWNDIDPRPAISFRNRAYLAQSLIKVVVRGTTFNQSPKGGKLERSSPRKKKPSQLLEGSSDLATAGASEGSTMSR